MAKAPAIIDLFSGVGGLSLGAVRAGFNLKGAVEYERRILDSHAINFPKSIHVCSDISTLSARNLSDLLKLGRSELAGMIGGPPCQGFSTIGKRSLGDKRNQLFLRFFQLAAKIKPAFFLAENVPGILNPQYSSIRNKALSLVEKDYFLLDPIKLNAKDFGAATIRTRIFFIGIRKDISIKDNLYEAIMMMKSKETIVKDALEGLPQNISESWLDFESSWQKIKSTPKNKYVKSINEIIDGVGDSSSIKRFVKRQEVSGCFGTRHTKEVEIRYSKLLPGQQDIVSKSTKLKSDGFCPTLRAGTDNTKGSFQAVRPIHYLKPRVITPREAARLQGFPDWFQFHETKWHSFRQIGNSVCPVVAEKVLSAIKKNLSM